MLDDLDLISDIDRSNMLETIACFPQQIKEAVELVKEAEIGNFFKIDNVIITGMGGSGVSGDIVKSLFRDKIGIPIFVNKEYDLPKWARKDTLTVFLSYSGDTEETLSSFKHASQRKCKIICISSGGRLQEFCEKRGVTHLRIPSGFQPREATAYLLFPLILIFRRLGFLDEKIELDIEEAVAVTRECVDGNRKSVIEEDNFSKQIARRVFNTIPQIYSWGFYYPIAVRWRTQFNENSKVIAREDVVSESNHNDIVGWSSNPEMSKNFSCILLRDKSEESLRISARFDFMKSLFENNVADLIEVYPKGRSRLAKMMYLMCVGDFVSCYLAVLRKIDPSPVDVISELKRHLAER
jgi:glucose/mannose-6-phosphate isomerase